MPNVYDSYFTEPVAKPKDKPILLGSISDIFAKYPQTNKEDFAEVQRAYVTLETIFKSKYKLTLTGGFLLKVYLGLPLENSDIDIYPYRLRTANDFKKILDEIADKLGVDHIKSDTSYGTHARVYNFGHKFFTRNVQVNFGYCGNDDPLFVKAFDFYCCMLYTEKGNVWVSSQEIKDAIDQRILQPYWPVDLYRLYKYTKLGFRLDDIDLIKYGKVLMANLFMYVKDDPIFWDTKLAISDKYTVFELKEMFKELSNKNISS